MASPPAWSVAAAILLIENRPYTLSALVMEVCRTNAGSGTNNISAVTTVLRSEIMRRPSLFQRNTQGEFVIEDDKAALRSLEVCEAVKRLVANKLERYQTLLPVITGTFSTMRDVRSTLEAFRSIVRRSSGHEGLDAEFGAQV